MAVFKSEKYSSLFVTGAGQFVDGSLEVEGEAAEKVRRVAALEEFGVTEVEADKPAPRRGRPRKTDD